MYTDHLLLDGIQNFGQTLEIPGPRMGWRKKSNRDLKSMIYFTIKGGCPGTYRLRTNYRGELTELQLSLP